MTMLRILLVEDHKDTLRVLARMLRLAGHEVSSAATAGQARALAKQPGCDLVVSDIGLPDDDGLKLMRELASQYGVPGIAMTGHSEEQMGRDCAAAGFNKHLVKPVAFQDLLSAIVDPTAKAGERDATVCK